MTDMVFYVFAGVTLVASLMVILSRNAVNGAMFMIVAFLGTAALFMSLEAYFLGILQVLVYAGAVMVLFLFIIMLISAESGAKLRPDMPSLAASILGLLLLVMGVQYYFFGAEELQGVERVAVEAGNLAHSDTAMTFATGAKAFGYGLFTKYMLPLQVAGFLLLTAMVGVILISRNLETKEEDA